MRIHIRYCRRDESTPRLLELSAEEYFDTLGPGETLSVDSVAKHQDAYRYTGCPTEELLWTVLEIVDGDAHWRVRTQLLDGTRTMMTHSQSSDGCEEIIHSTEFAPGCWHVLRTLKERGESWTVVTNTLGVGEPCRLSENQDLCGPTPYKVRRAFGNVQ